MCCILFCRAAAKKNMIGRGGERSRLFGAPGAYGPRRVGALRIYTIVKVKRNERRIMIAPERG
jgi:hypothetical protein